MRDTFAAAPIAGLPCQIEHRCRSCRPWAFAGVSPFSRSAPEERGVSSGHRREAPRRASEGRVRAAKEGASARRQRQPRDRLPSQGPRDRGREPSAGADHRDRRGCGAALVAVATAFSGFQAAKWDGISSKDYATSSHQRVAAEEAGLTSNQKLNYNSDILGDWLVLNSLGDTKKASLLTRRFTSNYAVAFAAWLKTDPLSNPKAPQGPVARERERQRRLRAQEGGATAMSRRRRRASPSIRRRCGQSRGSRDVCRLLPSFS